MNQDFDGVAQDKARFYFQDILAWVRDLYNGYGVLSRAFSSLLREYDAMAPRCRLRLYCKHRPESTSISLIWGKLITLRSTVVKAKRLPRHRVPKPLPGDFDPNWAFTIAKRNDLRARFVDFDRRAQALNEARAVLHLAIRHLKTSFCRRFKVDPTPTRIESGIDRDVLREVPDLPLDHRALGLPAMFTRFVQSAWIAAFSLGLAEEEMSIVAREVADNPSAVDLRLEIAERRAPSFLRNIYWIHLPTETKVCKLTHVAMRKLRVKQDVRPVLTQKELKRARIDARFLLVGEALDSLRLKCADAQLAVSTGLEQAKVIILPGNVSAGPITPRAAS
jgi:hypothetical protein